MEQGAEEEINRLKETLAATTPKMEQIKEDYADRMHYAEQLLEKAKADFREKNSRIKALEAHLDESRNEMSSTTSKRNMKVSKRNSSTVLNYAMSRQGQDVHRPHPCRAGPGHLFLEGHVSKRWRGLVLKHSPTPSEELYLTTKPKEPGAASHRSSHGLDLKDLSKLAKNIGKFNHSMQNSQNVQAYLQDIDFHLEIRPNVKDKEKLKLKFLKVLSWSSATLLKNTRSVLTS